MYERIFDIIMICTLSLVAFTLVAFGFGWVYEMWLAEEFDSWMISFIGIPVVALISALLVYLFSYAMEDESDFDGGSHY